MRRAGLGRSSPPRSSARSKARMLTLRPRRSSRNPLKTLRNRPHRRANEANCGSSLSRRRSSPSPPGQSSGRHRRGLANEAKLRSAPWQPLAPAEPPSFSQLFHRLSSDVPHGTSQLFHRRTPIRSAPYHPGCYSGTSYFYLCLIVNCKSSPSAASASSA